MIKIISDVLQHTLNTDMFKEEILNSDKKPQR